MSQEELIEDDIDLETLQAQIDLSMAHTKDLVASWIKPGRSSSTHAGRRTGERDIEELLRRPPRLGVGAPIPAASGINGIETIKLKNKLVGKKRGREEDETSTAPKVAVDSDDEEGRGTVIKKKAKVDPFASKGKKKNPFAISSDKHTAGEGSSKATKLNQIESPSLPSSHDVPSTQPVSLEQKIPETPKKKKKHKHSLEASSPQQLALVGSKDATQQLDSTPLVSEQSKTTPPPSVDRRDSPSKTKPGPLDGGTALPLLNLDGPPPITTEQSPSSPDKKKRKRRKKKKTSNVQGD